MAGVLAGNPEGTGMTEAEAADALLSAFGNEDAEGTEEEAATEAPEDDDGEPDEGAEESDEEAEDPAEEEEPEEPEEPELYTVKVNGEEVQVSLDELRNGYSRQADYTRKTQEVAEREKAATTETEAAKAERAQYAAGLEQISRFLEGAGKIAEPDWDKVQAGDPEALAQYGRYQVQERQRQAVEAERQRLSAQQQREAQAQREKAVKENLDRLIETIPGWKDKAKRDSDIQSIRNYALNEGFEEEVINEIYDHRIIKLLNKAKKFDELERRSQGKVKKRQGKPLKTGGRIPPQATKVQAAEQRFRQASDIHSAAELFHLQSGG